MARRKTKRSVEAEAGAMLRRVVTAVEAGELDAPPGPARKLLGQMEGAAAALEVVSAESDEEPEGTNRA